MNRFDRNERFFGIDGQQKLRVHHLAIVGCGGLGTHVAQQAAFLGVGKLTLIDDEELARSNLNRYVLARHDEKIPGTKKVDIVERAVRIIDPNIEVTKVAKSLRSAKALEALNRADTIIGCLDNDGARLVLTEFSKAYNKDYFDLASDIENSDGLRYGGRVVFCGSDSGCPVCLGAIDLLQAQKDLEDDANRQDRQQIYGVDVELLDEGGPSVVSVNGVVASLAVTEFMVHTVGLRAAKQQIVYRGNQGIVTVSKEVPPSGCYYCTTVRGAGAIANVERYVTDAQGS